MRKFLISSLSALCVLAAPQAHAHFQLIYTPEINLKKAGDVPLKLIFWHPMENGHVMDMGQPEEFYSVFKGKKTDLSPSLAPSPFKGVSNEANAFDATVKLKRNGDYKLVLVPSPYLEKSEDIYIQQITKVMINKGGVPTDWAAPVGLKTEIIPLSKPYGAIAGSTFSGIVLKDGQPAANIEIEIEHITAEPDLSTNQPSSQKSASHPGGAIVVMSDKNAQFSFGLPKAGYWGFAALGSGPDTQFQGKELSQDAVLWIKAHELEQ
ncbi:conserved exported hypothetical protein [Candidatus Terasakiella magnetica]|uniref:ABC-type Co2+ transport system, periplasmic component n=1 Tax=Candidatus Terasakiella magnetica TaxID=1867952 RepID=A0A1C3RE57_9PROT|nr:DUF4198 domain-containing protein [Candidatus Terasakiella magnetica]SCA55521.1 conserved exported hypothetical protein [Candidatus Terasakiella magnetica]